MAYMVKEAFKTLQGEGANAGRVAVFCRFSGCNLWTGRDSDRSEANCKFCDTDFIGINGENGGKFETAGALAGHLEAIWSLPETSKFVVFTGGEPLLQLDRELVREMHERRFQVAVETNGTLSIPDDVDWICVSPKAGTQLAIRNGHELKLVFPQKGVDPSTFTKLRFDHFWLQPMDGPDREANTAAAVSYCLANPEWRLSVQTHKFIGIP